MVTTSLENIIPRLPIFTIFVMNNHNKLILFASDNKSEFNSRICCLIQNDQNIGLIYYTDEKTPASIGYSGFYYTIKNQIQDKKIKN